MVRADEMFVCKSIGPVARARRYLHFVVTKMNTRITSFGPSLRRNAGAICEFPARRAASLCQTSLGQSEPPFFGSSPPGFERADVKTSSQGDGRVQALCKLPQTSYVRRYLDEVIY
jgi:hypothetical protein